MQVDVFGLVLGPEPERELDLHMVPRQEDTPSPIGLRVKPEAEGARRK